MIHQSLLVFCALLVGGAAPCQDAAPAEAALRSESAAAVTVRRVAMRHVGGGRRVVVRVRAAEPDAAEASLHRQERERRGRWHGRVHVRR